MNQDIFNRLVIHSTFLADRVFNAQCGQLINDAQGDQLDNVPSASEAGVSPAELERLLEQGFIDAQSLSEELVQMHANADLKVVSEALERLPKELPDLTEALSGEGCQQWIEHILLNTANTPFYELHQALTSQGDFLDDTAEELISDAIAFNQLTSITENLEIISADDVTVDNIVLAGRIESWSVLDWLLSNNCLTDEDKVTVLTELHDDAIAFAYIFKRMELDQESASLLKSHIQSNATTDVAVLELMASMDEVKN